MPADPVNPRQSANARAAAWKSPWRYGPHATSKKAKASYAAFVARGKARNGMSTHPNDVVAALDAAIETLRKQRADEPLVRFTYIPALLELREKHKREARNG